MDKEYRSCCQVSCAFDSNISGQLVVKHMELDTNSNQHHGVMDSSISC